MAQGDTTVRIDFEVGGANDAKIKIMDIYKAQKVETDNLKNAAKQLAQSANISYGDAMKAVRKYAQELRKANQEQARAALKPEISDEDKKRLESAKLLEQQRRFWHRKNLIDAQNDSKRAIREELAEKKRALREEERERRRMRRQEEAEARRAGGRGLGERLLGRTGNAMLMGIAGYAGAGGIASIISGIRDGIQSVIDKRAELERAITPIVALEDNVSRIGSIRSEVVKTSLAMGRSYEEVGRFYADLVGSTGNLAASQRDELIRETKELADLTGGSLTDAQNLLTKSYQIYGSELKNVNELQNKIMLTQDQGSIEFNEMALRLPELLQTGKFAGMGIDEVLGTVIGATRKSGSIEKTMTGLRNFYLVMEESQKKGVTLTGTYVDKLRQLSDLFQKDAPKMQELFGKEVVVHASSVTDAMADVTQAIKELGRVTGETDSVAAKLAEKFKDPTYFATRDMQAIQDTLAAAPNLAPDVVAESEIMKLHRKGRLGAIATQTGTGGMFGPLGTISGYLAGIFGGASEEGSNILASMQEGEQFKATMRKQFEDKKASDMRKIKLRESLLFTPAFLYADPWNIEEDKKEIMSRKMPKYLEPSTEGATTQSGSVSVSAEDKRTHDLLSETNRLLSDIAKPKSLPKPGGSKSNYEEAL